MQERLPLPQPHPIEVTEERPAPAAAPLSVRAVALGFLLVPLNIYWIGITEGVWHALHMTCVSLPMNALLQLIALVGLNGLLKRFSAQLAFSQAELMTTFMILFMQGSIIGHDNLVALMGVMPAAYWFDTPERRWDRLFHDYLPSWLVIPDKEAAQHFFVGKERFYGTEFVQFWLRPALCWTAILFLLFVIQTCLNIFVRRQWAEHERLTYPIVQLPMEITRGTRPPFIRPLFWLGFAIAALIDLVNGLNWLYPKVPYIRIKDTEGRPGIELSRYLTEPPWNAIGWTPVRFYPFVIGFGFLLPLDICFSCWFFYLINKAQRIIGSWRGYFQIPRYPFQGEQAAGGMMAVFALALWGTRHHLKQVVSHALFARGTGHGTRDKGHGTGGTRHAARGTFDDRREPLPYRVTLLLTILAAFLLAQICFKAGMSFKFWLLFFGIYFAISFAITRIRAEAGPPAHATLYVNPQEMMLVTMGSKAIARQDLTLMSLFWWLMRLMRNHPMPTALECFRIAELMKVSNRQTLFLLWATALVSIIGCFIIYPPLFYKEGAINPPGEVYWVGQDTWNRLAAYLNEPRLPDRYGTAFMFGGFLFTMLLGFLRLQFGWFPFHPIGFALGMSSGGCVDFYWTCLVVAWAVKAILFRYGGSRAYRQALPFFIGLILGECIVACSWSILGLILHRRMYDVWW